MICNTGPTPLVLASTSRYRHELLERLSLPFTTARPEIDETPGPGESADKLVERLARQKAEAVAAEHPDRLIIGSDQVACLDGRVLGKPGDRAAAVAQLEAASGREVEFLTGLALLNTRYDRCRVATVPFRVRFRSLRRDEIDRYIDAEQPFDCAGSFKSEGLGITLFAAMQGDDPTALIGLPLIELTTMLRAEGVELP